MGQRTLATVAWEEDGTTRYLEVGEFPGGHGAPLETRANLQSIKAFVMQGAMSEPQGRAPHNKLYYYLLLFLWAVPVIWLVIAAVIAGFGYLVWRAADRVGHSRMIVRWLAIVAYLIALPVAINLL